MFNFSGNARLRGGNVVNPQSQLGSYSCFMGRSIGTAATVPKYGRRHLPIFGAKFTVNTNQSSNGQQILINPATSPTPRVQPTGYGLIPLLAGSLVALTAIVGVIQAALNKDKFTELSLIVEPVGQRVMADTVFSAPASEPNSSDANVGEAQKPSAKEEPGQGLAAKAAAADTNTGALELCWQQRQLELEQARTRQSTSDLQRELREVELDLLKAQREGSTQVAGTRVELKESRRKAELLEAMVGALRERLRREEERNTALEEEVESGRAERARFAQQRRELQERLDALRMELADTQAKLLVAQARAAELDARLAHLVVQNKELELRVRDLEAQLQERTATVASAASAAEDKLRLMQVAADEDRLHIAKLQGKLAEREAQLEILREGETELQEVLGQSKAAARQMSELLRQRDSELQRVKEALRVAEERRLAQETALNTQITAVKQERESSLKRLEAAVQEAETRQLEEASAMKKKLEELQRRHEEQLQRLRAAGGEAGAAAHAKVASLKEELVGLQSERDKEVALLNLQLQESARDAEELREAAKAQAVAQQAEVQALQKELEDAKLRAEHAAARRVAEVSELRSALEQQLGAARQEAVDARAQLATVKEQLDGVLSEEFLQLLEDELRPNILTGANPQPATTQGLGPPETVQELRNLDLRETAIRHQLESLTAELAELQSAAVARLGPALVARAQELEGAASQCRKALRVREEVGDQQGIQRISQQLSALNSELAALYRSVMVPEARSRETRVRLAIHDREAELRGVVGQQVRLQDQLERERRVEGQRREKALAAASGPTQQNLRKAVQTRIKELVKERERQMQQQAVAREKQLQAQLWAAQAGSEAQQRELRAVQEAVERQARLMEESWKVQLEANGRALQEAAVDKQRLAAEVNRSTEQVRQQLAELESLRRELVAARSTVASLRRAAENSRATAAQQSVSAEQEVQRLTAQVQQLQNALKERERQYAASGQATASAQQATAIYGPRSVRPATPAATASPVQPASPQLVSQTIPASTPPWGAVVVAEKINRRKSGASVGMVTDVAVAASAAVLGANVDCGSAMQRSAPDTGTNLQLSIDYDAPANSGFKPLTPLRPGWPAQYSGPEATTSQPRALGTAAKADDAMARAGTKSGSAGITVSVSGSATGNGTGHSRASAASGGDGAARNDGHRLDAGAKAAIDSAVNVEPVQGVEQLRGNGHADLKGVGVVDKASSNGSGNLAKVQATALPPVAAALDAAQIENVATVDVTTAASMQLRTKPADELAASKQSTRQAVLTTTLGDSSFVEGSPEHQQQRDPAPSLDRGNQDRSRLDAASETAIVPVTTAVTLTPDVQAAVSTTAPMPVAAAVPVQGQSRQLSDVDAGQSHSPTVLGGDPSSPFPAAKSTPPARHAETQLESQEGPTDTASSKSGQPQSSPVQSQPQLHKAQQQRQERQLRFQEPQAQVSRRSVPPGPFDSTSLPLAAATGAATTATGTKPSAAQAQQASPPQAPEAQVEDSGIPATPPALSNAPASQARASSSAASSSSSVSSPSPPSSSAARTSANTASASASAAPVMVPVPMASLSAASGATGVFINPMIGQQSTQTPGPAAPSPPPIKPLTPVKVPTPTDFADFKQASPAAPAKSTAAALLSTPSPAPKAAPPAAQKQAHQAPLPPSSSPPGVGSASALASISGSGSVNTKPPQSPAAAAMAAAAGAAAAARRAAAAVSASAATAPPTGFDTPPISEWGRPKSPSEDVASSTSTAFGSDSASPGLPPGTGSETRSPSMPREGSGATTLFSDAELGAEIAAIAQALVQRTIGGGTRLTQSPPPPLQASQTASKTPSAAAAGRDVVPATSAAAATAAIRLGTSSIAAAIAGSASQAAIGRRLQLSVAAYGVPHVAKAEKGSEDAYFMLTPASGLVTSGGRSGDGRGGAAGVVLSALGVADGVGGWVEANVDPGQYSREVMDAAARAADEIGPGADPRQLLAMAQDAVRTIGSCTACVAVLGEKGPTAAVEKGARGNVAGAGSSGQQVLTIANLGDSGCRVVRRGSLVLATSAQEHQFNMPYQMAHPDNLPDTDTAADAQMYQLALEPGDVVVLATDGLLDNMWDEELVSMVTTAAAAVPPGLAGPAASAAAQSTAQQLAASLVAVAFRHAQDPGFRSPWAVELANQPAASWISRLLPRGGKMDDITAVIAIVTAA